MSAIQAYIPTDMPLLLGGFFTKKNFVRLCCSSFACDVCSSNTQSQSSVFSKVICGVIIERDWQLYALLEVREREYYSL